MPYEIVRNMPSRESQPPYRDRSPERIAMEQLEIGDGFWITDERRLSTARSARYGLHPKLFTIRKVSGQGWQVRRVA